MPGALDSPSMHGASVGRETERAMEVASPAGRSSVLRSPDPTQPWRLSPAGSLGVPNTTTKAYQLESHRRASTCSEQGQLKSLASDARMSFRGAPGPSYVKSWHIHLLQWMNSLDIGSRHDMITTCPQRQLSYSRNEEVCYGTEQLVVCISLSASHRCRHHVT